MSNLARILVADDLMREQKQEPTMALRVASEWATTLHSKIHLIHAYDFPPLSVPAESLTLIEGPYLDAMVEALESESQTICREKPALQLVSSVERGHTVDVILRDIQAYGCELLVLGTHSRHGMRRAFLGSVAEEVIRRSTVPVLTVNPQASTGHGYEPKKILVPLDLSEPTEHVVEWVASLAKQFGAAVTLVTVVEEWVYPVVQTGALLSGGFVVPVERDLEELGLRREEQLQSLIKPLAKAGVKTQTRVLERAASVASAIIEEARTFGFDLIVMGHRHASRLQYALLGSVSRPIVREAPCPVVTIPPPLTKK